MNRLTEPGRAATPRLKTSRQPRDTIHDEEQLDKRDVAQLSMQDISEMATPDLIRVLHASQVPLLQGRAAERLRFLERDVLERLVYLARRCCRNQGY